MRKYVIVLISIIVVLVLALTITSAFAATTKKKDKTVDLEKINGYLEGEGAKQSFTVYCNANPQTIEFTQPEDADFWVKVLGMDDNFLGDFQLSEGEQIELSGGGRFSLVIRSESGSGAWTAIPVTK